jgi:hypothetical protein
MVEVAAVSPPAIANNALFSRALFAASSSRSDKGFG